MRTTSAMVTSALVTFGPGHFWPGNSCPDDFGPVFFKVFTLSHVGMKVAWE